MKLILSFILLFPVSLIAGNLGEYKGHEKLDKVFRSRIVSNQSFSISSYTGELKQLMGEFNGFAAENKYRNGKPNALNLMLYRLLAIKLSNEFTGFCSSPKRKLGAMTINPNFMQELVLYCKDKSSEQNNKKIWHRFIGFGKFDQSFENFHQFASQIQDKKIEKLIEYLMLTPQFLLEY